MQNAFSSQQITPTVKVWDSAVYDKLGTVDDFPVVDTTYRVSERWQTGVMSRNMPFLVGLMNDTVFASHGDLAIRYSLLVMAGLGAAAALPFWLCAGRLREELVSRPGH